MLLTGIISVIAMLLPCAKLFKLNTVNAKKKNTFKLRCTELDLLLFLASDTFSPIVHSRLEPSFILSTTNWHLPRASPMPEQQGICHLPLLRLNPTAIAVDLQQPLREFRVE